jgi:PAS domain-containing protein
MQQPEIEIVLARQWASCLSTPILIVDPHGDLLYFNEAAEPIVGRRFDETGVIRRGEWSALFRPRDVDGKQVPRERQPLLIATEERRIAWRHVWIRGLDGVDRQIVGVAVPLLARDNRLLGVIGLFSEMER